MGSETWRHHNVSDNVHDIIRLTDLEKRIMEGPLFNRLHYVNQDSAVFFTWPAVRIQRFEHSLGCMHLAGQMFFSAIANADADVLNEFEKTMRESLLGLIEASPELRESLRPKMGQEAPSKKTTEGLKTFISGGSNDGKRARELDSFSFLIPSRVPSSQRKTIMYLAEGVRLAGMLHDLGHPPFSHVCEHVLTALYDVGRGRDYSDNLAARGLVGNIDSYLGGKSIDETALHETIGNRLSQLAISQAVGRGVTSDTEFQFGYAAGLVAMAILNDMGPFGQLHAIVSGTVDADRLDFVQRDSKASGVGADAMQYGRLVEGLRLMKAPDESFVFALPSKALPTVEDFLRKRLSNYKTIVFHHRVVKSEELLESALKRLAVRYLDSVGRKQLEGASGSGSRSKGSGDGEGEGEGGKGRRISDLYVLPNNVSGLWTPLAESLRNETDAVLTFSQWNDSWLLTMLREEYTRLKIDGVSCPEDKLLLSQLAELLYSEKSYKTVVKRPADCLGFREALRGKIAEGRQELNVFLDECEGGMGGGTAAGAGDGLIDAHGIVRALRSVVNANGSTNVLRAISENFSAFKMVSEPARDVGTWTFVDVFKGMVEESLLECGCDFEDVIVTRNHIKTGIGGNSAQAYFYSEGSEIRGLREMSAVGSVLEREVADLPAFFIYVLCEDEDKNLCRSAEFFTNLADQVYSFIYECVCRSEDFIQ